MNLCSLHTNNLIYFLLYYSMCPFLLHTYVPTCVVFYLATYNIHVNVQYVFTCKSISTYVCTDKGITVSLSPYRVPVHIMD